MLAIAEEQLSTIKRLATGITGLDVILLTQTKRNKGAAGWDKMAGWETKENVQIGENSGGYGRGI